jgi:hypothetical protein
MARMAVVAMGAMVRLVNGPRYGGSLVIVVSQAVILLSATKSIHC